MADVLEFKLKSLDEKFTEIEVTCKPVSKMLLIDNGRNLRTITKIVSFLENCDFNTNM